MRKPLDICWGTACPLVTRCARSDYNKPERVPGVWMRHYYPTTVGDQCTEFLTLERYYGNHQEISDT